jgi:thymidylate synthase ThyX
VGERGNRRHRPGRAFERTAYRFDIVSDYGAFRDLQRHRMLTIEWQELTPDLGYEMPALIEDSGLDARFESTMARSAELYALLSEVCPAQAPYALSLAFRLRYSMQMNAREAMHVAELRSGEQGHPAYRVVAQDMHTLIAQRAGHRLIAEAMAFVDHDDHELERLGAERRAEARRTAAAQS